MERQVTPHPNLNRRGKMERIPSHHGVSNMLNGVKTDSMGGGDPLGGRSLSGFHETVGEPLIPKTMSHPSFRGSRLSVRPSLEGGNVPEKSMQSRNGDVNVGDSLNRFKIYSPPANKSAINGENSLILVANGQESQNGTSDPSKN